MDTKAVLEKVNGLNSSSTLKRWKKLAENLTGTTFKNFTDYIFDYSESDVAKFQMVANLKTERGLKNAILIAFGQGNEPSVQNISEYQELENKITSLKSSNALCQLDNQRTIQSLQFRIAQMEKRLNQLEELPKIKKMLR
ncbi:MAG: hypothetical protein LBV67_06650 [Streptococcaceae bacterium]|jgi:hypothetical protein|nr:hypothetical protein [Streptococcaceae bacterium]